MNASEWLAEQHAADQRRFLHVFAASAVAHVAVVAMLAITPTGPPARLPEVLRVDLIASLPPAPGKPAPAAKAPPAPAAKPQPRPRPQPKQIVLPKEAPQALPKKVAPPRPRRPEPVDYEDALSQLRRELGETAPPVEKPAPQVAPEAIPEAATAPRAEAGGAVVDPELAQWHLDVRRHLRSCWITPPEFLNRQLTTRVRVRLTAGGVVLGTPEVLARSGDPFFDDNTLRAISACAPLPPPPQPGSWAFSFTSEQR